MHLYPKNSATHHHPSPNKIIEVQAINFITQNALYLIKILPEIILLSHKNGKE